METTLNEVRPTYQASLAVWVQKVGRPFVARWWLWLALIISPAYLAYYFTQCSLEERVTQTIRNLDRTEEFSEKGARFANTFAGQAGYFIGTVIGTIMKGWRALSMITLFLCALLHLQYKLVFRPLFEYDVFGRRIYVLLVFIVWLVLAYGFRAFIGEIGSEYNYQWTLANSLILLNVGYSLFMSWRNGRHQQLALIQQRTQAELDALKAQVNPHFLFNSLNNIYGTAIVEDSPRTAESIQQLSGIVRYVMEESRLQMTDIQRELRFINDFVELQRIRLPNQDNIEIVADINWDEKPAQVVPLLLNPLIENAFKYGISMQFPCFVRIRLRVQDGTLHLTTENSILTRTDLEKGTGLGLANVRQRLALAYPDRHILIVSEENETFLVDLTIKL